MIYWYSLGVNFMRLEENCNESHTLAWFCKAHGAQGGRLCARKMRGVSAACRIKPRNRATFGRLRGMCWGYYTRAYQTPTLDSAGRGLPHNPCRGDGLGARPPTLDFSRRTDSGPTWCALPRPTWCATPRARLGLVGCTDHHLPKVHSGRRTQSMIPRLHVPSSSLLEARVH